MNTKEYRLAPSNLGPHRLINDLCSEVECLQFKLEVAEINQDRYRKLIRGEDDFPKLLVHRDKHGDYFLLVPDEEYELDAWLLMFRRIDEVCWYYNENHMESDELKLYQAAKKGDGRAARDFLSSGREYEYVYIESIDTPFSLYKKLDKLQ